MRLYRLMNAVVFLVASLVIAQVSPASASGDPTKPTAAEIRRFAALVERQVRDNTRSLTPPRQLGTPDANTRAMVGALVGSVFGLDQNRDVALPDGAGLKKGPKGGEKWITTPQLAAIDRTLFPASTTWKDMAGAMGKFQSSWGAIDPGASSGRIQDAANAAEAALNRILGMTDSANRPIEILKADGQKLAADATASEFAVFVSDTMAPLFTNGTTAEQAAQDAVLRDMTGAVEKAVTLAAANAPVGSGGEKSVSPGAYVASLFTGGRSDTDNRGTAFEADSGQDDNDGDQTLALDMLVAMPAIDGPEIGNAVAAFDGSTVAVELPNDAAPVLAEDVLSVSFWLAAGKTTGEAPVLSLSDGPTTFAISTAPDRKSLIFRSTPGGPKGGEAVGVDLTRENWVHVTLLLGAVETEIYLNGVRSGTLTRTAFQPDQPGATAFISLGGPGFIGLIGRARVYAAALSDRQIAAETVDLADIVAAGSAPFSALLAAQAKDGSLQVPARPALGLWRRNGAARTIPRLRPVAGVPDVNHGLFEDDEPFYAISAAQAEGVDFSVAGSMSTTAGVHLKRAPGRFDIYVIATDRARLVGGVKVAPDGLSFRAFDTRLNDFFAEDALYKAFAIPNDGEQSQAYGEAWQINDKPKNFDHSIMGCYDPSALNPFDLQEHGCDRRFFREPPATSHRFDPGQNNLTIPWGWKYINISETRSRAFSAMGMTERALSDAVSGSEENHFVVFNVNHFDNKTTEDETERVRATKRVQAHHHFVARRFSVVVDAKRMMLDQCFLRDVARAAYGLVSRPITMPDYFADDDTAGGECDALLEDPLSVADLVARYAPNYAYAITYGAKAIGRTEMTAPFVGDAANSGTDVKSGTDAKFSVDVGFKKGGFSGGTSLDFGGGSSSETANRTGNDLEQSKEFQFDDMICVGGSGCSSNSVEVGDNPTPIYLDLRSMTDLLGPPYFADPAVTGALRRAVAAELAAAPRREPLDIPVLRMFDVKVVDISCWTDTLDYGKPLTTMQKAGLGPFAPTGRYANVPTDTKRISSSVKDIGGAKAAFDRSCLSALKSNGALELAVEYGGSNTVAKPSRNAALSGAQSYFPLSDLLDNKSAFRVAVEMFDAALGGGPETHPMLYPRLRPLTSKDANGGNIAEAALGADECAAPCGFNWRDPQLNHSEIAAATNDGSGNFVNTGDDFRAYVTFEGADMATMAKGGGAKAFALARGVSILKEANFDKPSASEDALAYGVNVTLEFKEVTDLAQAMGYE